MATTIATETTRTAADLSIKTLTQILTMLAASTKNMSERKKTQIRDIMSKPHDVFIIPKERMHEFTKRCREYNIPFHVVRSKGPHAEPYLDVIVREMDRGAVNRIAEQMGITLTYVEQAREGMQNLHKHMDGTHTHPPQEAPAQEAPTFTVGDDVLSRMLGEDGAHNANPIPAQMEHLEIQDNPSALLFGGNASSGRDFEPASVRAMIQVIRAERDAGLRLPPGREALQLPDAQRPQLPPGKIPQLPSPKVPQIELKGR